IADEVKQFLSDKDIPVTAAIVPALYVRQGAEGVERVVVDVRLPSSTDALRAQVALNQFKATAPRTATRPLSYAQARTVSIRLRDTGSGVTTIDLPRAAQPDPSNQPPARRPGGAAKEAFDLSSFYANEGALGDSDNNLIPDRVDVLLS